VSGQACASFVVHGFGPLQFCQLPGKQNGCALFTGARIAPPRFGRAANPAQFGPFWAGLLLLRAPARPTKTGQKQAGSARTTKVLAGLEGGCSWRTIYGPPRLLNRELGRNGGPSGELQRHDPAAGRGWRRADPSHRSPGWCQAPNVGVGDEARVCALSQSGTSFGQSTSQFCSL
jgi:hypothetical protein